MLRILLIVLVVIALPGCTWLGARARINPSGIAYYPQTDYTYRPPLPDSRPSQASGSAEQAATKSQSASGGTAPCVLTGGYYDSKRGAIDLDCFRFPGDDQTAYARAAGTGRPVADEVQYPASAKMPSLPSQNPGWEDARLARNRLSAILVKHADDACLIEKGRLVAVNSTTNFVLSFLTQGLSGASTIVGGEQAKSILSGLATLSAGTQDNVNATFYRNQLTAAIGRSLDQERGRLLESLNASRTLDIGVYSVDDMIVAVNRYHQVCSFERGLQLLLDAAGDAKGATSALENRARERAIDELKAHRKELVKRLKEATGTDEATVARRAGIEAGIKQIDDKILGLELARADKLIEDPDAGATSEKHPETEEAAPPPSTDNAQANTNTKKTGKTVAAAK